MPNRSLKFRAHTVPKRARNRAEERGTAMTNAKWCLCPRTGSLSNLAGAASHQKIVPIRPEEREVTGSTPVPTTGKRPDQGVQHLERGISAEATARS